MRHGWACTIFSRKQACSRLHHRSNQTIKDWRKQLKVKETEVHAPAPAPAPSPSPWKMEPFAFICNNCNFDLTPNMEEAINNGKTVSIDLKILARHKVVHHHKRDDITNRTTQRPIMTTGFESNGWCWTLTQTIGLLNFPFTWFCMPGNSLHKNIHIYTHSNPYFGNYSHQLPIYHTLVHNMDVLVYKSLDNMVLH